jgi:predicted ATPase
VTTVNADRLAAAFQSLCGGTGESPFSVLRRLGPAHRLAELVVYGHRLRVPWLAAGRRCAKFTFTDLCSEAYGAADFIALGKLLNVVALTDIASFPIANRNEV